MIGVNCCRNVWSRPSTGRVLLSACELAGSPFLETWTSGLMFVKKPLRSGASCVEIRPASAIAARAAGLSWSISGLVSLGELA